MSAIEQLFLTISAIAGSTALWKFFETRLKAKIERQKEMEQNSDTSQYREALKKRVEQMSVELEEARRMILALTQEVAELRTENKYLKKEIDILKSK